MAGSALATLSRAVIVAAAVLLAPGAIPLAVAAPGANEPEDRLFGQDRIVRVRIEIGAKGVERLRELPKEYVPGSVRVGERAFSQAEVRLKGHGSFTPIDGKPNFSVRLDKGSAGRRAFGHTRLLLNNSSQDPSFIRWKLASELFLKAGLPAARVNFAQVTLNDRDLGLYVLVEPTDTTFLAREFGDGTGNLYEGSNTDVEDKLEVDSDDPDDRQHDLQSLAAACREPDLQRRWHRLQAILDVDRFASFMALEVLICHHDGYSLDRNNYRIYHDPKTQRLVFIPHGMDLIFDFARLPLEGTWRGTVARAFMETPEGRRIYRQQLIALGKMVYGSDALDGRITVLSSFLREHAREAGAQLQPAIDGLRQVVQARRQFVMDGIKRWSGQ